MKTYVETGEGLPRWTSPISHAVVVGDICHLSGQLSVDEDGHYVPGSTEEEARRAFANLFSALAAAGFTCSELVFVDVALIDIYEMPVLNTVYAELFPPGARPARTVCQVAALPFHGRVKVMGVAIRDSPRSPPQETGERR